MDSQNPIDVNITVSLFPVIYTKLVMILYPLVSVTKHAVSIYDRAIFRGISSSIFIVTPYIKV